MGEVIRLKKQETTNFLLFIGGKSISILGTSIYSFAIGLYVLKLTGSAFNFATTLMLSYIPMIVLSPIAGVVADRIPKRRLVVGMDIASGLLFLLLYLMASRGMLSLPIIYVSIVILNIFATFFGIGIEAAKPNLVLPKSREKLNAVSKLVDSISSIAGPMLGGVIYAFFNIHGFMLINGISFLISAFTEWFIRYDLYTTLKSEKVFEKKRGSFQKDLREGLSYVTQSKGIMDLVFIFAILNFVLGFSVNVPMPYMINEVLQLSTKSYGLINAMFPIGLIMGTLTVLPIMKGLDYRKLLVLSNGIVGVLVLFVAVPVLWKDNFGEMGYVIFYSGLYLLLGMLIAYVDVPIMTLMQNEIPEELLGRAFSLVMSFIKLVLPIALLLSGILMEYLPILWIPVIGGSLSIFYSIKLILKKDSHMVRPKLG